MDVMVSISNSTSYEDIDNYVKNGTNIFRYNFSHIDADWFKLSYKYIRAKHPTVKLLQDLQGTKIRISNKVSKTLKIDKNRQVCLCSEQYYLEHVYKVPFALIPICYSENFSKLFKCKKSVIGGTEITLLKQIDEDAILGILDNDLIVKPERGVNFRGLDRRTMKLTEKDKQDLNFLKKYPMEYVCLSFVENPTLILELKEYLQEKNIQTNIIAKIETLNGYNNLKKIIPEVYGIMFGRGDMVKEVSIEKFFEIQTNIINIMEKQSAYFIVGTYILDNMINAKKPTVSELIAISYFKEHNVDCLMLANEILIGKNPQEVVSLLHRLL